MCINLSTFLGPRSPFLNSLNFFNSQNALSYKALSYKKERETLESRFGRWYSYIYLLLYRAFREKLVID